MKENITTAIWAAGVIVVVYMLFVFMFACAPGDDDDDDTADGRTPEQICELYAVCHESPPECAREDFRDCMDFPGHCVVECAGELDTCNYDAANTFGDCASDCEAW